jgi:GT2 family glycosyltransferase
MLDIIIPTKGNIDYLFKCLNSIQEKTQDTPYHIYVCDTGSTKSELSDIQSFLKSVFSQDRNVTLVKFDFWNFAKINNIIVNEYCKGSVVLFCNNDIELIDNCIDPMYSTVSDSKDIGSVGCRLLFSDGSVQHAGQVAFIYNNRLEVTHRGLKTQNKYKPKESVMGNTGGFMMVKRDVFIQVGQFNENYIVCFEDVEFNMKLVAKGYTNIYLDDVSATHYESLTRTKTQAAMTRLGQDYNNNLAPFFASLDNEEKNKVLGFNL